MLIKKSNMKSPSADAAAAETVRSVISAAGGTLTYPPDGGPVIRSMLPERYGGFCISELWLVTDGPYKDGLRAYGRYFDDRVDPVSEKPFRAYGPADRLVLDSEVSFRELIGDGRFTKGLPALPDDFNLNFADTMYGSEVVAVRRTESPDYCLVYYNSNERDSRLGMVPSEVPALTDGHGRKLAFDRLDSSPSNDVVHFYVLDDRVVVVSGMPYQDREKPRPFFEMERNGKLYERVFETLPDSITRERDNYSTSVISAEVQYESVFCALLDSRSVSFELLKNTYNESLIAHRLAESGTNVCKACEEAAGELGVYKPFLKFMDGFISDFADLLEMGEINHEQVDFCLLRDVSEKFPEVYQKVRESVSAEKLNPKDTLQSAKNDHTPAQYKEGLIAVFDQGYKLAKPTREVIRGEYAKDFVGEVTWSRALDFKVPEMPDFRGIRYIDFVDCTNLHVLYKNGESKPIGEMSELELRSMKSGFERYLKNQKRGVMHKKSGKKGTGSPSM